MTKAVVFLWGNEVGTVLWNEIRNHASFQYDPDFIKRKIQISPLVMPLRKKPYEFQSLEQKTFKGLPGLLADSLPDKFGNVAIDAWTTLQGFEKNSLNSVKRLQFIGSLGMGAIEYKPSLLDSSFEQNKVDIAELVVCSNKILNNYSGLVESLTTDSDRVSLEQLIRVGTFAGGSRAKAILAWNPKTNEFLPDQYALPKGYEHWLIKFDGISNNRDKENADPQGYGKIEYAYYLMALEAGIKMSECRLFTEKGRSHFMTKRFDRNQDGTKNHMQSLCAIAHLDFNQAGRYSYEDAINVMKQLHLPNEDFEQLVLRTMFNVVGRNQDDHVKNIAFLMDSSGDWRLSPAFDVTFAYDPNCKWTNCHQMSINGKRDNFIIGDLIRLAQVSGVNTFHAYEMLEQVVNAIHHWPEFGETARIDEQFIRQIQITHRTIS